MKTFDLSALQKPCECGRQHTLAVKDIIIEHDALTKLKDMLKDGILSGYSHPVILCDSNTLKAARGQMEEVIAALPVLELSPEGLHANNEGVALVEERIDRQADLILALGSGTIHDLSRYVAHEMGIDFVACPTASSVDGFVSTVAAMTWNGMKATLPAVAPVYVIADTTVLSKAPYRLTASGMSDLFGKYTALVDWRVAHLVTGEYICERICRMELDAINEVKECMAGLKSGDEEAHSRLMYALLLSGLAMQMVGNSRPASCAEHHMSHFWEMKVLNEELDALHGEKVGVGLLLVTREYHALERRIREGSCSVREWTGIEFDRIRDSFGKKGLYDATIKENTPDPMEGIKASDLEAKLTGIADIIRDGLPEEKELEDLLRRGGCCVTVGDIGLSEDIIPPSLELSCYVRNRLSLMRLKKMLVY
ncbi:MAG: sn-glycerol-1-phosphate dehydrogenase [Lachnospiraceae bacterium]|nr:sn-glycerol-1-phosphate dehydrogenase [Lachnospiraceae bacterium]